MKKRTLIAVAAASCAGILTAWFVALADQMVRRLMGAPAVYDSASRAAATIMLPVLLLGFPVFCWFYVLPQMRFFLRKLHVSVWRVPISAFLCAAIVWLLFCILLHSPRLDSIMTTAMAMGAVVWWPVFAASCAAGYVIAGSTPAKKDDAELSGDNHSSAS